MCVVFLVLGACRTGAAPGARPSPSGPPTIDYALVRQHALQFDVDIPTRPPGSQLELAAATYILGHLQLAGYGATLTPVPVADQVQSSNVIALPRNSDLPSVVVTIGYDHSGRSPHEGSHIGMFLELARALNAAAPDHRVAFAALGAETQNASGSFQLASFLAERDMHPQIIEIRTDDRAGFMAVGSCAGPSNGVFAAGLDAAVMDCLDEVRIGGSPYRGIAGGETIVRGGPSEMGPELLRFCATTAE